MTLFLLLVELLIELTADRDDPLEDGDRGQDRDEGECDREDEGTGRCAAQAAERAVGPGGDAEEAGQR